LGLTYTPVQSFVSCHCCDVLALFIVNYLAWITGLIQNGNVTENISHKSELS